jgi:hypothetical protein
MSLNNKDAPPVGRLRARFQRYWPVRLPEENLGDDTYAIESD